MRAFSFVTCCWIVVIIGCADKQPSQEPTTRSDARPELQPSEARSPKVQDRQAAESASKVDPRATDAMDVTVLVLKWSLDDTADPEKVCFIAMGATDDGWIDPTPGIMERLGRLGLTVRPASEARLPKPGEMEAENRFRGVEDPDTGQRCYIYYAEVTQWRDDATAEVSYGLYGGPLDGRGGTLVVEKKGGEWMIKGHLSGWVS